LRDDGVIPVFPLAHCLYGPAAPAGLGAAMVVADEQPWALGVDWVGAEEEITADQLRPFPGLAGDPAGPFPALVAYDEELTLLLAPSRLRSDSNGPLLPAIPDERRFIRVNPFRVAGPSRIVTFSLPHAPPTPHPVLIGISVSQLAEIYPDTAVLSAPFAPPFVTGLANWRSVAVPVIDLAGCLGLPPAPHQPGCRLIVSRPSSHAPLIGLWVNDDIRRHDLPIPHSPWEGAVDLTLSLCLGVYRLERDTMLIIPDLGSLAAMRIPALVA
jgi:chemotaxis signal transduction protein